MKNKFNKLVVKCAIAIAVSSTIGFGAMAMKWTAGDGCNVIDCRNGWYCTTCNGQMDWGSTWDNIWSGYFSGY